MRPSRMGAGSLCRTAARVRRLAPSRVSSSRSVAPERGTLLTPEALSFKKCVTRGIAAPEGVRRLELRDVLEGADAEDVDARAHVGRASQRLLLRHGLRVEALPAQAEPHAACVSE